MPAEVKVPGTKLFQVNALAQAEIYLSGWVSPSVNALAHHSRSKILNWISILV